MTREEAAEIIKHYDVNGCGYCHQGGNEVEEAFEMAVTALKQERALQNRCYVSSQGLLCAFCPMKCERKGE